MKAEPTQTCKTCGISRSCLLHTRAEFPPDAAAKWIKRRCPHLGTGAPERPRVSCDIVYEVGIRPGGPIPNY